MKLLGLLSVGVLAGLWQSLEVAQCKILPSHLNISRCYNTSSGKTCFTKSLTNNSKPVRKPFEEASRWCNSIIPGSSLIIINRLENQRTVEIFLRRQVLQNETVIMDARQLLPIDSLKWSWINGHKETPYAGRTETSYDGACVESKHGQSLAYCFGNVRWKWHYICEYSVANAYSTSNFSHRQDNKTYVASERNATWYDARKACLRLGGDLASITDLETIKDWSKLKEEETQRFWIGLHRNKWIWNNTGVALTYANWEGGFPNESPDKKCICLKPSYRSANNGTIWNRKWRTCSCNRSHAIVCQKEEKIVALTTEIVVAEEMPPSTSAHFKTSASSLVHVSAKSHISMPSSSSASSLSSPSSPSQLLSSSLSTMAISSVTKAKQPEKENSERIKFTIRSNPATSAISSAITTSTSPNDTTCTSIPISTTPTSQVVTPVIPNVTTHIETIADTIAIERKTVLTSSLREKLQNHFAEKQTTTFESSSSIGLLKSFSIKEILLILVLLTAVVFIAAAVILIVRKRKFDRRNEESSTMNTTQGEAVSSVYATVVPVNRPSAGIVPNGNTIYAEVELTQRPTCYNNAIYASVESTGETIDLGKSVIYADLNLPRKDQQKPWSPFYSQPYEPHTAVSNAEYAEPFKPDKKPRPTAPTLDHHAATDQQNIYSLARAIPLDGPNVIYSEVNKSPTAKAVETTDPIYLKRLKEIKLGAVKIVGDATQNPSLTGSAVYVEPVKLQKSS